MAASKKTINWGIMGAGNIARSFARDLKKLPGAKLKAVGSRSIEKAEEFAKNNGASGAYGSYLELARDPDIDVVYIATPHSLHKQNTLLCLQNGKAVLCEKAFALNAREAREMIACAKKKNLFLMEAMWTRFLPVIKTVMRWLEEKRIGEIKVLNAELGLCLNWNPEGRVFNRKLAGGALLDVGVYPITLALMVFGKLPCDIQASASIGKTGVDEQGGMVFRYDSGELAVLSCAVRAKMQNEARIIGTKGTITIPGFWYANNATLQVEGKEPVHITGEAGYHFEAAEVMACLRKGKKESPYCTLADSLSIMKIMDKIRSKIGLAYPNE